MNEITYPKSKIARLIKQMRHLNEFPTFLPRLYPGSPKHPISSILRELVPDIVDQLDSLDDESLLTSRESLHLFWQSMQSKDELLSRSKEALTRFAVFLVVNEISSAYFSLADALRIKLPEESEVFRIYPELADLHDEDYLLHLQSPLQPLDGGILYKEHVLHYHQFLRRNFSSNPNFDFLGLLANYYKQHPNHKVKVALDHRRIMRRESYRQIIEMDRWFGPPLVMDRIDDRHYVGLTVHRRPEEHPGNLADKIDRTEFFWSFRSGLKTFEAEEIHSQETDQDIIVNRYIHSQRDIKRHVFIHLDGAAKVYPKGEYRKRFQKCMPRAFKASVKTKLFRVDGDISLADWSRLLCYFFRGNEMVLEYVNPNYKEKG